jgi:serine/threonine protein kinase
LTDAKVQGGGESSGPPDAQMDERSGSGFGSRPKPQSFADTQPANTFWGTVIPPGFLLAGRYRIDHFIARGGMGEVYAAHDCVLADKIALKTVTATASGDVEAINALRAEVTLSRKISHPNVCRMHDIGVHVSPDAPQLTFLTMEYVDGESLGARLLREGAIPEAEAARMLSGILAGLQAAHDAGVLHRDLKSDNVMLRSRPNSEPTPLIMDFGLASALSPNSSRVSSDHAMVGSLAYMAPEQVQGDALRVVTDVYSVGVIFFEALTGQLPFKATSPALAALKRLHEPAPRVRSVDPRISQELDRIVAKALQHRPQDRYPSARAMHQELLEYMGLGEQSRLGLIGGAGADVGPWRDSSPSGELAEDDTTLVSGRSPRRVRLSAPPDRAPVSEDSSLPVLAATAPPVRARRRHRMRHVAVFGAVTASAFVLTAGLWLRRGEEAPASNSVPLTIGGGGGNPTPLQASSAGRSSMLDTHVLEAPREAPEEVASTSAQVGRPLVVAPSTGAPSKSAGPPHGASLASAEVATRSPPLVPAGARKPGGRAAPGLAEPSKAQAPVASVSPTTHLQSGSSQPNGAPTSGGNPELVYPPGLKRPSSLRPRDEPNVQ